MHALVTGGAGFIGSAIARELLDRGDTVRVLDNLSAGRRSAVPEGAEFVEGDLRNADLVEETCEGIDVVFHHAAVRSVPQSLDDPGLVHAANVTGTLNLLLAAARTGVGRLIYASSSSVYGGAADGASHEDDPPHPLSPYGVSKLAAEYYCVVWAELGRLPTISLRYFNVFGPGQSADSKYAAVFPAFVSALQRSEPPQIHWDGEQSRDFTFIDDVARANILAAEAGSEAIGRVLNIAGGRPRTINETFESIAASIGTRVEPIRTAKRDGDIRNSFADATRARHLLGWEPKTDWDDAVKATVEWFKRTSG